MKISIIDVAIGYMLKVLKSGTKLSKYQKEFAAIRHGNYFDFINLVGELTPFMIVYHEGRITQEIKAQKGDIDFAGLLKAEPSLKVFYKNCLQWYGKINDPDMADEVFSKVALFEISLRMHANNNHLLGERENLIEVIDKLCSFKQLSPSETETLQKGRAFVNMVKGHKRHFSTWTEDLIEFENAFEIIKKHQLTII